MMAGSYIGVTGIPLQDQAITESMGTILDRSQEHLAGSDRMLVLTRRLLLRATKEYAATGKLPEVLDNPALSREARGGDIVCAANTDWLVAYEAALDEAVTHEGQPLRSAT
jgi:hypothetical protein